MSKVHRLFIEKKPGLDFYANSLLESLRNDIGVPLRGLRVLTRLDIEGLSEAEFLEFAKENLHTPSIEELYIENVELNGPVLAIELLPGQFDSYADSAASCAAMFALTERPRTNSATVLAFEGADEKDMEAIKRYLINPVEAREAAIEKPDTLEMKAAVPEDIKLAEGFIGLSEDGLEAYHSENGFAMSFRDMQFVQKHFAKEKRDPTHTELKVIDTYWSDHCRHTTFLTELETLDVQQSEYKSAIDSAMTEYDQARSKVYGGGERAVTLMDLATLPAKLLKREGKLPELDESEEVNACAIKVKAKANGKEREMTVLFKNETHNHPTEIEPFGGAATCLGGGIRDPLSGRAYAYQAMRITGSGDPRTPLSQTLPGKLSQRNITTTAAKGYSFYGNQIGLTSGLVKEYYHPGFVAKRMELGAVLAAAPSEYIVREKPVPGDCVLLIGGRTGRDGLGGATGSSQAHTEESHTACGAQVQKGDPVLERRIQRLYRNPEFTTKVKRCNDFGAGGVSVAIGELADSLLIDLDKVPVKYAGLDGTELAISESQERMAVVVAAKDVDAVLKLADEENLEATQVATVVDDGFMTMTWRGKTIVRIEREFLNTNGVRQFSNASVLPVDASKDPFKTKKNAGFLENLADLNVAENRGLVERFDSTIGRGTLLMPYGGERQMTPAQAMAALIPMPEGESSTATIMAHGFDPDLGVWSPFHAGLYAVVESVARVVASGGDLGDVYLSMQEYFERLGDDKERWGKPAAALLGALKAQLALQRAAVGGKDSMSGSFENIHVPPTLVCVAVCPAPAEAVTGGEFKRSGSRIALLDIPRDEYSVPDFEALKKNFGFVTNGIRSGKILGATALGRGGIAAAMAKACLGNGIGLDANYDGDLYMPRFGAFLIELADGAQTGDALILGETNESGKLTLNGEEYALEKLERALFSPLEGVFPVKAGETDDKIDGGRLHAERAKLTAAKVTKPLAVVPVFPGTTGEYDLVLALEEAGAAVETPMIASVTKQCANGSVVRLAESISRANMLILSGGLASNEEQPDGSGKAILAAISHKIVRDAIEGFLSRGGLILGMDGGFQALLDTGLLPYGEFREDGVSAALAGNALGRHVSRIVRTRVTSVLSPWFALSEAGQVHSSAFSSAEGRLVAPKEQIEEWFKNGQVAAQYVDMDGGVSMSPGFNPSGSMAAIEALCSPDGRILGVMGHSERAGKNTLRNVPGDYDRKLFRSGVSCFL